MSASGIRAGKAYVQIGSDDSALRKGLDAARARLDRFAASVARVGAGLAGAGAAITAPLGAAVMHFANAGDELDKMSQRTAIATDALQVMGRVASLSGVQIGAVVTASQRLAQSVRDAENGVGRARLAFDELGTSAADLEGLSVDQQIEKIAVALAGMEDQQRAIALSRDIFGRMGAEVVLMGRSFERARAEMERYGLAVSEDDIAGAAELTNVMGTLNKAISIVAFRIGGVLAPTVTHIIGRILEYSRTIQKLIEDNAGVVKVVAAVGVALAGAGASLLAFAGVVKAGAIALGVLGPLLSALPFAAVAAAALLMGAIVTGQFDALTDSAAKAAGGIWDTVKHWKVFGVTIGLAVEGGVKMAEGNLKWLQGFVGLVVAELIDSIGRLHQGFIDVFNAIAAAIQPIMNRIAQAVIDPIYSAMEAYEWAKNALGMDSDSAGVRKRWQETREAVGQIPPIQIDDSGLPDFAENLRKASNEYISAGIDIAADGWNLLHEGATVFDEAAEKLGEAGSKSRGAGMIDEEPDSTMQRAIGGTAAIAASSLFALQKEAPIEKQQLRVLQGIERGVRDLNIGFQ